MRISRRMRRSRSLPPLSILLFVVFSFQLSSSSQDCSRCPKSSVRFTTISSPLLVNFEPNLELTGYQDGVLFDLYNIGKKIMVGWTKGSSNTAWVIRGRKVENFDQMWGNNKPQAPALRPDELANAYRALRLHDKNNDGQIDAGDAIFSELFLWWDKNHDGLSTPEEIAPFSSFVKSFSLNYKFSGQNIDRGTRDGFGNYIQFTAPVELVDGTSCKSYDVVPVTATHSLINQSTITYDPKKIVP